MTSVKKAVIRSQQKKIWIDGYTKANGHPPSKDAQMGFTTGFGVAWSLILTKEKLYRTFNIHWVSPDNYGREGVYILVDNDGNELADIVIEKFVTKRFKYYIGSYNTETGSFHEYIIDQNNIDRFRRRLKKQILEDVLEKRRSN